MPRSPSTVACRLRHDTDISRLPQPPDDKAYVTGSRLPVRDNSSSASVKGIANKDAIDDMMNRASQTYIPPKGGHELERGEYAADALDAAARCDEFGQLVDAGSDVLLRRVEDEVRRLAALRRGCRCR